jgi:fimbrial isopeptide formation D2 family protein/LPXTG-motif cell wall-anchored protein
MKKFFCAVIAMLMLLSCFSMTSFADDNDGSPSETSEGGDGVPAVQQDEPEEKKHVYELYQIFTGDFNENVLSNIKWGENGTGVKGEAVSKDVTDALKAVTNSSSDTEKLAVIKNYAKLTNTTPYRGADEQPEKDTDGNSNGYTYTNVTPGYYLIKDKSGTQTGERSFYTLYVVKSAGDTLYFEPKGSIPTVSKKVAEDGGWYTTNNAAIGEDVQYQITGTVSSRIADFATYYYKISDTLSKGLTFKMTEDANGTYYKLTNGGYTTAAPTAENADTYASTTTKYSTGTNLKVYLLNDKDKEDVTTYFWIKVGDYSITNGTSLTIAIGDLKALLNVKDGDAAKYTLNSTSKIVVEYTAVVNENAVVKDPNTNEVMVTYSNDPNDSGTPTTEPPTTPPDEPTPDKPVGESVKSKTETYTTSLVITKVDGSSSKPLTGAEFTLTGNGIKQVLVTELTFVKADDGTYYKLTDGTYTLTEPVLEGDKKNSDNYASTTDKYKKSTIVTLKGEGLDTTDIKGEVDADGVVTFTGLCAGTYTLTESKTPAGYNTMDPITFTISFDNDNQTFSSNRSDIVFDATKGTFASKILNYAGSTLPHTGGIGTTIFYTLGSALVLTAAVLLIVKKRMDHEQE